MYLDPAFGGMLIQVVLAIAVAGGAIVFGMRKKISAFFGKNKDDSADFAGDLIDDNAADIEEVVDVLSDND
jgi:hypothetical protein